MTKQTEQAIKLADELEKMFQEKINSGEWKRGVFGDISLSKSGLRLFMNCSSSTATLVFEELDRRGYTNYSTSIRIPKDFPFPAKTAAKSA
jgi:hypothetical protein